jgi:hypothetical protein
MKVESNDVEENKVLDAKNEITMINKEIQKLQKEKDL